MTSPGIVTVANRTNGAIKFKDQSAGSMAIQSRGAVNITGGTIGGVTVDNSAMELSSIVTSTIDETPIGFVTPSTAHFTTIDGDSLDLGMGSAQMSNVITQASRIEPSETGSACHLQRHYETLSVDITADVSIPVGFAFPEGTKIIGVLMRVDTALTGGETWDATWNANLGTQIIAATVAVDKNTKIIWWVPFDASAVVAGGAADIAITKAGGGAFTAAGTITAVVFTEAFLALADL